MRGCCWHPGPWLLEWIATPMPSRTYAREELRAAGERFTPVQGDFRDLPRLLAELEITRVDGILLDLGVSSHQLDTAQRGFSFQQDGPLDMRMDRGSGASAADLVNTASREELERIFREYGEEPRARSIVHRLVTDRDKAPFTTTGQLAEAVERAAPRSGPRHPATRVFQALRIAVNDELGALKAVLEAAPGLLNPGGRIAVITFHSLEDRIVKHFFKDTCAATLDRPEWPAPRPNPRHFFISVPGTPATPGPEECVVNPRARSARLRAAERRSS